MKTPSEYYILKAAVIERIKNNQEEIHLMELAREIGVVNLTHHQFLILIKYVHDHFPEYWLDLQYKADYPDNPTPADQILAYKVFSSKKPNKIKDYMEKHNIVPNAVDYPHSK